VPQAGAAVPAAGTAAAVTMRQNEGISVISPCGSLRLDPYTPEHVPVYHRWMSSPTLLAATGSEPLTAAEEADSCAAWRADPDKLTFILVSCGGAEPAHMAGDVNVVFGVGGEEDGVAEVDVMVADVRLRRRGVGTAAVRAAMAYAACVLQRGVVGFVAKIKTGNAASLALFEKLGFVEVRRVAAFGEIHLGWTIGEEGKLALQKVWEEWKVRDYADVERCVT
jgi:RimJ/RimL family protein N-acetyltransferase